MAINFDELKGNPLNPRSISKQQHQALQKSLAEFGDLGAFVFNVRLHRIVSGHQRKEAFEKMGGEKELIITQQLPAPTPDGTVALGYLKYGGNYFSYREVDWPEVKDLAAMEAANRIGGDWELDKLADVNQMIKELDESYLELTGQSEDELKRLEQLGNTLEVESQNNDGERMTFNLTPEQTELVNEVFGNITVNHKVVTHENMDVRTGAFVKLCELYLTNLHASAEQTNG